MSDGAPQASFTRAALARFDGRRGRSYVALDGAVYDVSSSAEWRGGLHRELHWAGQDLSAYLPEAPHGREVLARYARVGSLAENGEDPAAGHLRGATE